MTEERQSNAAAAGGIRNAAAAGDDISTGAASDKTGQEACGTSSEPQAGYAADSVCGMPGAGEDLTARDGFAADGQREHIKVVLCGASKYDQKYYFNRTFDGLPENVKEELHILCVLFTEEVGGIFTIVFTPGGDVEMETQAEEGDLLYDEISCGLMIREIRRRKQELFQSLSAYYKIKILHQNPGDVLDSGWDDESDGGQE